MAIGTAGYTAMLCIMALERHGRRRRQRAAGRHRRGRRRRLDGGRALWRHRAASVAAVTGRAAEARLPQGRWAPARSSTGPSSPGRPKPLAKERWAGGIDAVGGAVLANVISMTSYGGAVAACGNAGGMELTTSVAPFILRGVALLGIDSGRAPKPLRIEAWTTARARPRPRKACRDDDDDRLRAASRTPPATSSRARCAGGSSSRSARAAGRYPRMCRQRPMTPTMIR